MVIGINGNVGIGTAPTPTDSLPDVKLRVKGSDTDIDGYGLEVQNGNGDFGLIAHNTRTVQIGALLPAVAKHACLDTLATYTFANCASAAEYVPTLDGEFGVPVLGDVVSIAPTTKNPCDDEHAPFVVTKNATSCDPNLLGFITDPEKGADGDKLNEHYLPLAIYGYFPAKVTMEGGAIRRGDPTTSSSTPGAGMKATGGC